ncbi:MAG: 5-formyltetrahydrofolate cyclo-ligase, partial [Myxococcota bacterium]
MSPESLVARKRALRRIVIKRRRALAPGSARAASRAVATHISVLAEVIAAEAVALYAPRPGAGELDTRPLFELVHRMGKRRLLPGCTDAGGLEYVAVERWESLRPGRYGIPEPEGESVSLPGPSAVVVCPGVAFDASGGRLGMGRGYLDRT